MKGIMKKSVICLLVPLILFMFLFTAQAVYAVTKPATAISLPAHVAVVAGGSVKLTATLTPSDSTDRVIWTIGNGKDFSIDQNGNVKSNNTTKDVTTLVTAKVGNLSAQCYVHAYKNPPTSDFSVNHISNLIPGQTAHFTASTNGTAIPDYALKWSTGNKSVLTIDADGNAKAIGVGKTYLYVETYNGEKKQFLITVASAPQSISISSNDICVQKGKTVSVNLSVTPSTANDYAKWTIGNAKTASISTNAYTNRITITGVSIGNTTLTATSYSGKTTKVMVRVLDGPVPTGITLPAETYVDVAKNVQAIVTLAPSGAAGSITYRTGNQAVAKVSSTGIITGVARGNTYVYAKTANGIETRTLVRVGPQATDCELSDKASLGIGSTLTLEHTITPADSVSKVTWRIGNPNVATVNQNGAVTGKSSGKTYVYLKVGNLPEKKCLLTVETSVPITSITMPSEKTMLAGGSTYEAKPTINPENANAGITWSIGNTAVAVVDSRGVVTAKSAGNTWLTATSGNAQAKTLIRVLAKSGFVTIDDKTYYYFPSDGSLAKGYYNGTVEEGKKYLFSKTDGEMLTGFQEVGSTTYYFLPLSEGGDVAKGIQEIDGKVYCFNQTSGARESGYKTVDGKKYYFSSETMEMLTGFQEVGTTTYYFLPLSEGGDVAKGLTEIEGKRYYFYKDSGAMKKGYTLLDAEGNTGGNLKYYFDDETGEQRNGLIKVNVGTESEATYLFLEDGDVCKNGLTEYNGKTYYFSTTHGSMAREMVEVGSDGSQQAGGKKYYFDPESGEAVTGVRCSTISNPNGFTYFYDPTEVLGVRTGLQTFEGNIYLLHPNYGYAYSGFQSMGEDLYYFDPETQQAKLNTSWDYYGITFTANGDGKLSFTLNATDNVRSTLLYNAFQKLGVHYGQEEGELVCSTFAAYAYESVGIDALSEDGVWLLTYRQAPKVYDYAKSINKLYVKSDYSAEQDFEAELQPGDLIYFDQDFCYYVRDEGGNVEDCKHNFTRDDYDTFHIHHVAIYIGNHQVIEANEGRTMVVAGDYKESDIFRVRFAVNIID